MDVGSQVAARGTGGTAADRREMHCSFPQRSASLQQAEAFLGIKDVVNTHPGAHSHLYLQSSCWCPVCASGCAGFALGWKISHPSRPSSTRQGPWKQKTVVTTDLGLRHPEPIEHRSELHDLTAAASKAGDRGEEPSLSYGTFFFFWSTAWMGQERK